MNIEKYTEELITLRHYFHSFRESPQKRDYSKIYPSSGTEI